MAGSAIDQLGDFLSSDSLRVGSHFFCFITVCLLICLFPCGISTQLQSSGLVAYENSTFRNLALAVSGPFMA